MRGSSRSVTSRSPLPEAAPIGVPDQAARTTDPGRPQEPSRARSEDRDAFFDNAKYLAIVLVAVAHAWEPFRSESRVTLALYLFVYTFHMPAFIVISGYFSRSFDWSPRKIQRLITGVVVPYVVFETAYGLFRRWATDDPDYALNLIDPWFITWFLIALFIWRLTVPLWQNVRWPLPIAIVVGLLASITPGIGAELDLQRVLQFLPFFVLGLVLKPEHFAWVGHRRVRLLALPVAALALIGAYWAAPRMAWAWFFHRDEGQALGVSTQVAAVMFLALFACSVVMTACFLALVPRRRWWFSALGASTLYGYLLHGFVVKAAAFRGWYDEPWLHTPLGKIAVTVMAATVVTLLCTPPVRRVFRCVMEPRMAWLFRTPVRPKPEAGRKPTASD